MIFDLIGVLLIVGNFLLITFSILHLIVLVAREQCSRLEIMAALGGAAYLFGVFGGHMVDDRALEAARTIGLAWVVSPYIAPLAARVFHKRGVPDAA